MRLDFSGKKAVVTGGANGIGLACARALAQSGAEVCVFDLEKERPGEVAAGFGAKGLEADVSDRSSLDRAFAAFGAPDVVVANAGTVFFATLEATTSEIWERTMAVNLSGTFRTIQAAVSLMRPRRSGSIVVTASTNSFDGEADLTAYNVTKAGLLGLVHTAANELGPFGIRINAVCPGLIRTRLTEAHFGRPELAKPYFRNIPLGRGGEPEEVAAAALFLASGQASFITGTTLVVDGGQMAAKFGTWNEETAEFRGDRWRLK